MLKLLAVFILIPVIELIIIVRIGYDFGFWPALGLIVVPGIVGAAMAHSQGTIILLDIKREIFAGRLPGNKIVDGMLLFLGGVLLITPGIITDILGLTVLFPGTRKYYRHLVVHKLWNLMTRGSLKIFFKK